MLPSLTRPFFSFSSLSLFLQGAPPGKRRRRSWRTLGKDEAAAAAAAPSQGSKAQACYPQSSARALSLPLRSTATSQGLVTQQNTLPSPLTSTTPHQPATLTAHALYPPTPLPPRCLNGAHTSAAKPLISARAPLPPPNHRLLSARALWVFRARSQTLLFNAQVCACALPSFAHVLALSRFFRSEGEAHALNKVACSSYFFNPPLAVFSGVGVAV